MTAPVASLVDRARRSPQAVAIGTWVLLAVPVVVALVAQRRDPWFPIADLAQSELRVRDVGGAHTPLMGLAGRIGSYADAGSHPGPLSFWLLAPVYRLLGSTAFAFQAATSTLHLVAFALALWVAARRGGATLVVAVGAGLALLARYYGALVLFEGWNPYLPVSWWITFLLALWAVVDDDLVALPVLVLAGSICAQTHLPYLGLVGGLVGLLVATGAVAWWRGRPAEEAERRRRVRWVGGSALLGLLLWAPPLVEQVTGTGNLGKVADQLRHPEDAPAGAGAGLRALARNLDPASLLGGHLDITRTTSDGSVVLGLLFVLAWGLTVLLAVRLGDRRLLRWHAVGGAALALGALSATKISGVLWFYLFLWVRGLVVVLGLAGAATVVPAVRRWRPDARPLLASVPAIAVVALLASVAVATVRAEDGVRSEPRLTAKLGVLVGQTTTALEAPDAVGGGRDGRYVVRWVDPLTIGSQGIGLVNELERRGFDVGVDAGFGPGAVRYRVVDPAEVTGVVQLVVGPAIADWDARPDARQVAYVDDRTDAQRAEYARLDRSIRERLLDRGLDELAREWGTNLFTTALRPDVPADIAEDMFQVLAIGGPAAVYLLDAPAT